MKTIQKERIETKYYNVFVANDGTEFNDEAECKKYEESAKGVLSVKYKKLVVGYSTEDTIYGVGCEDNDYDIVELKTAEDKDIVMQMYFLYNNHIKEGIEKGDKKYIGWADEAEERIDTAIANKEILLIGRGYDADGFWIEGAPTSIFNRIKTAIDDAIYDYSTKKEAE